MENRYKSCIKTSNTSKETDYSLETAVITPDVYDSKTSGTLEIIRDISQRQDIFKTAKYNLTLLVNGTVKDQISSFIEVFELILNQFKYSSLELLPLISMTIEADSTFMEWVFRNFRVGFTFCEKKEDSMWFIVSNEELGRKSYSGDLVENQYYNIIVNVLMYIMENI